MIIKTLDKRMNGYGDFKYGVDFYKSKAFPFDEVRLWCWETFGPSTELDIWEVRKGTRNEKWAWDRGTYNKSFRCMLYLKDDQEMNWFKLRWGIQ